MKRIAYATLSFFFSPSCEGVSEPSIVDEAVVDVESVSENELSLEVIALS